ncbi:Pao retrotransposon peptidase family protein [Aphelenchoides avenae]|nr:Pao retrotransposon peptidase family protein [Aphelenchus avenae]
MHLEQEGTPLALEMLKYCYVDNVILMADNVNEALQKYRASKATFAKIQMPLREYASNNAQFNNAIDPVDRAELEKLRELGIRWDVTADYWDLLLMPKPPSAPAHPAGNDTAAAPIAQTEVPAHSAGNSGPAASKKPKRKRGKKTDDGRLIKRSMLRLVAPDLRPTRTGASRHSPGHTRHPRNLETRVGLGRLRSSQLAQLWNEAIKDFDKTIIRIPRRIAKGKIHSPGIRLHRLPAHTGSRRLLLGNLVYSRAKVKPIKDTERYTIPRMELLGVLVGARAAKFLYQEVSVDVTAVYLWSDSTIVFHQVADREKIKEVFVENRLKEIRQIRDQLEVQFRHVPTDDNPADIVSCGLAAAELQHCTKWWFGASFLAHDERHWPKQPASLGEGTHSVPDPNKGLKQCGSGAFAALCAAVFSPPEKATNRRFRKKRKPNPLDTITKPLPPTTVSAYVVAAMDQAARPAARSIKLPTAPVLPAATEKKYPVWTRQLHGKIIKDLKRARLLADLFWTLFRDGYLAELRSRGVTSKRRHFGEPEIHPGDLVLVGEPNVPRCFWRFALVLESFPATTERSVLPGSGSAKPTRNTLGPSPTSTRSETCLAYLLRALPRLPPTCIDLRSFQITNADSMGNLLSTTRTSTAEEDLQPPVDPARHAGDTRATAPNSDTTDSRNLVDSAHSPEDTGLATEPASAQRLAQPATTTPAESYRQRRLSGFVQTLVDAGPRADPVDQVDNSSATTSRRGSFTRNFRRAFGNSRQSTPSTASTPAQNTQPPEQSKDAKNTRGNWRPRGAFTTVRNTTTRSPLQPAQQQEPSSVTAAPTTSAADSESWAAPNSEPWGSSQQADPAHSAGDARPSQDKRTDPTHSVGDAVQPQVDRPSTSNAITTSSQPRIPASSTAARPNNPELIPNKPTLDQNTLPAYPSLDAIKREVLQCFSFESGPQGQQIAKVNDEALVSQRKRQPQDTDFGVYYRNPRSGNDALGYQPALLR